MSNPTKKIEIAIVGGGFAGLALAIGLQKYEHLSVNVYEGAHQFSEIGAGVALGPNAQEAMKLIDPRIFQGYQRRAAFNEHDLDANGLSSWMFIRRGQNPDQMEEVADYRHEVRGSTIHRAHFLDEMVQLVKSGSAHFGKRLDRIYETENIEDPVVLHFKDGTSVEADVVLGCDGIHSPTRKHVLGPDDPAATATFAGAITYRAVVPMEKAYEALGPDFDSGGQLFVGKDGNVIGFPLAGKTLFNVAVSRFNTGPWKHDEWIVPADVPKVKDFFKDWDPLVQKIVSLLPEGVTDEWSLWDMPPAHVYYRNKVAVVGDAAHATTPFQGSGAGQAFEDALVLSELLGKLLDPARPRRFPATTATTIPVILQTYDVVRRFRTQKVCATSREAGRIQSGNELGVDQGAEEMGKALGRDRLRWIWDYDQNIQIHDAFLLFDQLQLAAERASVMHPA